MYLTHRTNWKHDTRVVAGKFIRLWGLSYITVVGRISLDLMPEGRRREEYNRECFKLNVKIRYINIREFREKVDGVNDMC